jgi:hypothetical protein
MTAATKAKNFTLKLYAPVQVKIDPAVSSAVPWPE